MEVTQADSEVAIREIVGALIVLTKVGEILFLGRLYVLNPILRCAFADLRRVGGCDQPANSSLIIREPAALGDMSRTTHHSETRGGSRRRIDSRSGRRCSP